MTSTGQSLLGNNMYTYCANNPVIRADSSGMSWKNVRSFFSKTFKKVANWAKRTFGAGYTATAILNKTRVEIIPSYLPISAETGTITTQTLISRGNSSKPISVYADANLDSDISSSAGININISNTTININLALDDIGVSAVNGTASSYDCYALRCNLSEFKVGFEKSSSLQWDSVTHTSYTNVSISGWTIIAAYCFIATGQPIQSPQATYA